MTAFLTLVEELFATLDDVSFRRMFGGTGIFRRGIMFALVSSSGTLYMRTDPANVAAYQAEGMTQFTPEMRGELHQMPYWRLPERLFDDPEEFREWALEAFAAAERAAAENPKKKRKRTKARPTVN